MAEPSSLLLDTHVLLWWLGGSKRLSAKAGEAISRAGSGYVSAASAWEIAIKASVGGLDFPRDLEEQLSANRFQPLAVSVPHALAAATLPMHHGDPFDRMLVAQARLESLTLVTADRHLKDYEVDVLLI